MKKTLRRLAVTGLGVGLTAVLAATMLGQGRAGAGTEPGADDAALARARRQVQMLDDLYKTAVVSITQIYADGPPAVKVAKQVFKAMADGKHHTARLVDATGSPQNDHSPGTSATSTSGRSAGAWS